MSKLIFITGVSGYIGFQTLVFSLEAGYIVRAIVRKSTQIEKLASHERVRPYASRVTFITIPDLTDIDILVKNLDSVSGILHLASPLAIETDDYERDTIHPALAITNSILTAALRVSTINRVVITSSAVTLVPFSWLSGPDTEKIYNSTSVNTDVKGPYASPMEAYWSSKALSRIAVHEFLKLQSPPFDIVQLLPSVVIGPDLLANSTKDVLYGTSAMALGPILGVISPYPLVGSPVHVSDVAKAHVDSLSPSIPGNADYVLSSNTPDGIEWDDILSVAKKFFPTAIEKGLLRLSGSLPTTKFRIGTRKTEEAFGWKFREFEQTVKDLVALYIKYAEKEGKTL